MNEANRISDIQSLAEAADRPNLAAHLANNSNCTVSEARGILAAAALERTIDDDGASEIVGLARSRGISGFVPAKRK